MISSIDAPAPTPVRTCFIATAPPISAHHGAPDAILAPISGSTTTGACDIADSARHHAHTEQRAASTQSRAARAGRRLAGPRAPVGVGATWLGARRREPG